MLNKLPEPGIYVFAIGGQIRQQTSNQDVTGI